MVASEEVNLNPTVTHLGDLPEEAHVTTGDDSTVLKPVVEHIPEEVHRTRLLLDALQPAHQTLLHGTRILMIARPEVGITGEEDLLALAHLCYRKPNSSIASSLIISLFHSGSKVS